MSKRGWDETVRTAAKYSGGLFIKFEPGESIVGAFCGEPFAREVVWTGKSYEEYDPTSHAGQRPALKVMLNFYVPADGGMKIIEGGSGWFKDLLKVRDKYGLDKWLFEVSRTGSGKDTRYKILPEEKIGAELADAIADAELHDLPPGDVGDEDEPAPPLQKAQTITREQAEELSPLLKALPKSRAMNLLIQCGVKRISDVPMDKYIWLLGQLIDQDSEIPF